MSATVTKRRFTVEEYHWMGRVGILRPDERVELLGGEVYCMAPIGSKHAEAVSVVQEGFAARLAGRARVRVQQPILLSDLSEPAPDITIARVRAAGYRNAHPGPDDIFLVVEVSDTTLNHDRAKLHRYAAAGIPESWIANLTDERFEVYRDPSPDGYRSVTYHERGSSIAPSAFPDAAISVDDVLGPP